MKRIFKLIGFSLMLTLLFAVNAFAETKELKLNVDKDYSNGIFYISWENVEKSGSVELSSPDGKTYSKSQTPDAVYEANGEAIVRVGQATKGEWNIKVTGDGLGQVTVEAGQLPNSMVIDSFTVAQDGEKYIAKYAISDCPEEIQVEVFADADNDGYDGQSVYNGNGGATGNIELNLGGLKPGEYHFYIRVSKDGVSKKEYSESVVSFQHKDSNVKVKDVKGGKYNDGYYISWTNENENEKHIVYVWDADSNLIFENECEGDDLYYGEFAEDAEKIFIAVVNTDSNCNYDKIEVSKDTKVNATVTYDIEGNSTNHKFITADVEFAGKCTVDAFLNKEIMLEGEKEASKYKVNMSDGDNTVEFRITDESGNVITFTKNIYVDTVAPALSVSEDIDNMVISSDYIYISGYSEAGATLTLNGKEVTMKKGYFNEKISLDMGKNDIVLVAVDIAGNTSQYTATVTYELSKKSRNELYILAIVIIILIIIYFIVFIKGLRRRRHKNKSSNIDANMDSNVKTTAEKKAEQKAAKRAEKQAKKDSKKQNKQ